MSLQKKPAVEESYSADSFEESLSGSNSKQSNIWTEKLKSVSDAVKKGAIEDSLKSLDSRISGSRDKSVKSSAIEERESAEEYVSDFESMSKSKGEMMNFMANKPQEKKKLQTMKDLKGGVAAKPAEPQYQHTSVIAQYVRKENKQTMTDEFKYDHMSATSGETLREWSLKKNLEEAELMIQELKSQRAEDREEIRELELKVQRKDGEY